jgi:hypothetical protein
MAACCPYNWTGSAEVILTTELPSACGIFYVFSFQNSYDSTREKSPNLFKAILKFTIIVT